MQQIVQKLLLLLSANYTHSLQSYSLLKKHTGWWRDSDNSVAARPVPPAAPVTVTTSPSLIFAATSSPREAVQKLIPREVIALRGICYSQDNQHGGKLLERENNEIHPPHIPLQKLRSQKKYNKHDLPHAERNIHCIPQSLQILPDQEKTVALISPDTFLGTQEDLVIILRIITNTSIINACKACSDSNLPFL